MREVTDYIDSLDEPSSSLLAHYRERAMAVVPQAEEGTGYGMPALRYRNRPLVSVVRNARGYSVFPFSSAVIDSVIAQLEGFDSSKGSIKFTDDAPLPDQVFDTIVARRRDEIDDASARPRRR